MYECGMFDWIVLCIRSEFVNLGLFVLVGDCL